MTISKPERGAREWDTQVNLLFDRVNEFDAVDPTSLATDAELTAAVAAHAAAADPHPGYLLTVGPASGSDDTAAIQALLTAARTAGGGLVCGTPGEDYQTSAALVIGSGTTLDMRGCTVTLAEGSESHMVTNHAAANPVATASDGAVTSGSAVVTTALAASAVVGQVLTVVGAAANGYGPLIGNIASKTATTVTLEKLDGTAALATATVSGAAVELSNRDANIAVLGGHWNRGDNGPNGSTGIPGDAVEGHSLYFKHVDGLTVDIDKALSTAGVTFVWPTDVSRFNITVRDADVVRTAVQVVGPAYSGVIPFVQGICTDDLVNLCGNVYPDQTETCGDVRGITVGTIIGDAGASALKLNCGQGLRIDDIVVDAVFGTSNIGMYIGEDTAYPETTGGNYGSIEVKNLASVPANTALLVRSPDAEMIKIKGRVTTTNPIFVQGDARTIDTLDLTFDYAGALTTAVRVLGSVTINQLILRGRYRNTVDGGMVQIYENATVNSLVLDSVRADLTTTNPLLVRVNSPGVVDAVTLRDCKVSFANTSGTSFAVYATGGTCRKVKVQGGDYSSGAGLIRVDAGTTHESVHLDGLTTSGIGRLLNLRVNSAIFLGTVYCLSNVNAAIFTNGGTLDLYGGNIVRSGGTTTLIQRQASEVVRVFAPTLQCDFSVLTKAAHELATNTNAALSCGVGPAVCDGTNWKNLASGATY